MQSMARASHRAFWAIRSVAPVALTLALASTAMAGPLEDRGRALLDAQCSRCHAIDRSGTSALEKAPPFRTLGRKYKLETLAESLAEGIVTGHPDMPEARFKPDEIEAILAWLAAIAER